jgi:hypothetical protein
MNHTAQGGSVAIDPSNADRAKTLKWPAPPACASQPRWPDSINSDASWFVQTIHPSLPDFPDLSRRADCRGLGFEVVSR